jgi:hypothetical protein
VCGADSTQPSRPPHRWHHHGLTDGANGAPVCGRHNRLKNTGYRVHRDQHGYWHTYRPDGTEIC